MTNKNKNINHKYIHKRGVIFHIANCGQGYPLLLLHGWPEFWLAWLPVMISLCDNFSLYAIDLRGFGETGREPDSPPNENIDATMHAEDILSIMDELGFDKVGLIGHDMGAYIMQELAHRASSRISGMFFFNCPTPGIGKGWLDSDETSETWYQYFHQIPIAASIVGQSRKSCGEYIGWFLSKWSAKPEVFDEFADDYVENFMRPGNIQGGFDWYLSANKSRQSVINSQYPIIKIRTPTRVLWGERDPVMKIRWMDCLSETFTNFEASIAPGCGHFVHMEDPTLSAECIAKFFDEIVCL